MTAEQEANEAFSLIAKDYEANGMPTDLYKFGSDLRQAEGKIDSLHEANKENETITNYYWFCLSIYYYVAGMPFAVENAKTIASLIDVSHDCEHKAILQQYVDEMLGDEYDSTREVSLKALEKYERMSLDDKVEVVKYIYSRYDYYDKKDGKDTGDKYTDTIWIETSQKYGIAYYMISSIWFDSDVLYHGGFLKKLN